MSLTDYIPEDEQELYDEIMATVKEYESTDTAVNNDEVNIEILRFSKELKALAKQSLKKSNKK